MSTGPTGWVPVDPPGPGAGDAVTGPSTDPGADTGTPTGWVPATPAAAPQPAPEVASRPATAALVPADPALRTGGSTAEDVADAAPDDRQPAEVVRDVVLTAPGVVALSGGALGAVGTFLPGRRVPGVRMGPGPGDPLEVHVVAAYGTPVAETAAAVRRALAGLPASAGVTGRPVHVVVDDVALPGAPGPGTASSGPR